MLARIGAGRAGSARVTAPRHSPRAAHLEAARTLRSRHDVGRAGPHHPTGRRRRCCRRRRWHVLRQSVLAKRTRRENWSDHSASALADVSILLTNMKPDSLLSTDPGAPPINDTENRRLRVAMDTVESAERATEVRQEVAVLAAGHPDAEVCADAETLEARIAEAFEALGRLLDELRENAVADKQTISEAQYAWEEAQEARRSITSRLHRQRATAPSSPASRRGAIPQGLSRRLRPLRAWCSQKDARLRGARGPRRRPAGATSRAATWHASRENRCGLLPRTTAPIVSPRSRRTTSPARPRPA